MKTLEVQRNNLAQEPTNIKWESQDWKLGLASMHKHIDNKATIKLKEDYKI